MAVISSSAEYLEEEEENGNECDDGENGKKRAGFKKSYEVDVFRYRGLKLLGIWYVDQAIYSYRRSDCLLGAL